MRQVRESLPDRGDNLAQERCAEIESFSLHRLRSVPVGLSRARQGDERPRARKAGIRKRQWIKAGTI